MSIRNFEALFAPRAIALVGASNQPNSVGAVATRNLLAGGFGGPIMLVNPHEAEIAGRPAYPSVVALPTPPDLVVLATPARTVPGLIAEGSAQGARAAVVISAGFGEGNLRQQLLDASRPTLTRIVGPNCLGFLSPVRGINASFAHLMPATGRIALLSQSGAILTSMIDWAAARGIGFSHVVSLGDMSDVDFGDMLDYLALDHETGAILLYVETVTHARKFMSAARIASRAKPVIVVKAGRSASGAKAAATHTGALAGADLVYDAAFRRAGLLRVDTLRDLFEAAEMLASGVRVHGERLTILTNGGGAGVLATDTLEELGGKLASLSNDVRKKLDGVLPPTWSRANPIDIIGDADPSRYQAALDIVLESSDHDAILVMNCPTGVANSLSNAKTVVAAAGKSHTPVFTCWLGEETARASRMLLTANNIPAYETPDEAVHGFLQLAQFHANQQALMETPAASVEVTEDQRAVVKRIVSSVLADGRALLTEPEAKAALAAYGIATVPTSVALTPNDVKATAQAMDGPLVLKILSRDISHKSDVGGVRLNLTRETIEQAAQEMLNQIAVKLPTARIDGFTVQPMINRPRAVELIAGMAVDPTFGPVILFGQGGTAVEIIADRAMALPPLNDVLARGLIARTRISKLLAGYRDTPPAQMEAVEAALIGLSDLAADHAEIVAVDINPLLADKDGVVALDARIEVRATADTHSRFAIRPYPAGLRREVVTRDGDRFILRPIRPQDENAFVEMCAQSAPNDVRLRFHGPLRVIDHALATRLTQIDYDRAMAFVAENTPASGLLGAAHLIIDPDFVTAEYAIMVRSDLKGTGLGYQLMSAILDYAHDRDVQQVVGHVLRENTTMLQMVKALGGKAEVLAEDVSLVRVTFNLPPARIQQS